MTKRVGRPSKSKKERVIQLTVGLDPDQYNWLERRVAYLIRITGQYHSTASLVRKAIAFYVKLMGSDGRELSNKENDYVIRERSSDGTILLTRITIEKDNEDDE